MWRLLVVYVIACSTPSSTSPTSAPSTSSTITPIATDCRRDMPPETAATALPAGASQYMPPRGKSDGKGGFVVEGLPMQSIDGVVFSPDSSMFVAWNEARVLAYRTATLEPLGGVAGMNVFGALLDGGDIFVDTYEIESKHTEFHFDSKLALRGMRPGLDVEQRAVLVAPGTYVRASECANCGPKPVGEFMVWIAGSAPRELVEPGSASTVGADGTMLVIDERRIATRPLCANAWQDRAPPAEKLSSYNLLDSAATLEPAYVVVARPRANLVIDLATGHMHRFATYGKATTSPTGLLAYVEHDVHHDEPGELVVIDLASSKELARWPAGAKPRAFSRDGAFLAFARDRGDTSVDLHVVPVRR